MYRENQEKLNNKSAQGQDACCKSDEVDCVELRDLCHDEDDIGWTTVKRRGQRGKTTKNTTGEERNEQATVEER